MIARALPDLLLVGAMLLACAGLLVLVLTRRGGPGALVGCVVMGLAATAVTAFTVVPAVAGG